MRNSLVQLIFAIVMLVLGTGIEEQLPRFLGVGFPVLLGCVQIVSLRWRLFPALLFALSAGAFKDAVFSLPMAASGSFYVLSALLVSRVGFPRTIALFSYPCYLAWLTIWTGAADVGLFARLLLAAPIGFLTVCFVGIVVACVEGRAAFDEEG